MKNNKSTLNDESEIGIDNSHCTQKNLNLLPYWGLAILRFLLTMFPQTGYIHPDEYFQSVEVVAGDMFGVDVVHPWEFNSSRPIRSIVFPYLVSWLPFSVERYMLYKEGNGFIPPNFLLIGPRLVVCCISFINDYCLYCTCYIYGQNYRARLMAFASSYVAIIYGTRTLSNTIEMTLTSLVLYCVAEAMCHTDQVLYQDNYLQEKLKEAKGIPERVRISRLRSKLPSHTLRHCPILGAALTFGIFVRPTFLVFAAPAVFFWLRRGPRHSPKTDKTPASIMDLPPYAHFHVRAAALAACATLLSVPLLILDTRYYEKSQSSMNDLLPVVATPFNFILYNSNPDNLQLHGLHPRWLHVVVNLPLLFGPLGVFALLGLGRLLWLCLCRRWARLPRSESPTALMLASFIVPMVVLSAIPHQEPRFLLPLAFPVAFLHAQDIRGPNSDENSGVSSWTRLHKTTPYVWCLFNLILGLFYGFVHQGGVWPVTSELANRLSGHQFIPWGVSEVHVFTSHTYTLPRHALQLRPERSRRLVRFHEMGSINMKEVLSEIQSLYRSVKGLNRQGGLLLYLVLPGTLEEAFCEEAANYSLEVEFEWSHCPHLSLEAPLVWTNKKVEDKSVGTTGNSLVNQRLEIRRDLDYCSFRNSRTSFQERFIRMSSLLLLRVFPMCAHEGGAACLSKMSF